MYYEEILPFSSGVNRGHITDHYRTYESIYHCTNNCLLLYLKNNFHLILGRGLPKIRNFGPFLHKIGVCNMHAFSPLTFPFESFKKKNQTLLKSNFSTISKRKNILSFA